MLEKTIVEAKKRLFRGEVVIFPTETVYGIGSNAENEDAVKLIYKLKKRPFHNPLICHFSNIREIEKNFILKEKDIELAQAFWPGPLTLILKKKEESKINTIVSNNQSLVGCRIPNNKIALDLIKELDFPLAAPSANIATKTSITSINDLDKALKNIFYIDGGSSVLGLESTVLQTTKEGCKILRLGSLTIEEIKNSFKFNDSIIRNLVIVTKKAHTEDSALLIQTKEDNEKDSYQEARKEVEKSENDDLQKAKKIETPKQSEEVNEKPKED